MEMSSGVILYRKKENGDVEFFMCTPDGPYWKNRELWSFPKGRIEENETPFDAAIREFHEETSIKLEGDKSKFLDLGIVNQNKFKNVYVFAKQYNGENTDNCISNKCLTEYPPNSNKFIEHNEIKSYKWLTINELKKKGIACYLPIYSLIIRIMKYN